MSSRAFSPPPPIVSSLQKPVPTFLRLEWPTRRLGMAEKIRWVMLPKFHISSKKKKMAAVKDKTDPLPPLRKQPVLPTCLSPTFRRPGVPRPAPLRQDGGAPGCTKGLGKPGESLCPLRRRLLKPPPLLPSAPVRMSTSLARVCR